MSIEEPCPKNIIANEDFLVGLDGNGCVGLRLVKKVGSCRITAQIGTRITDVDYTRAIILKLDGTYLAGKNCDRF